MSESETTSNLPDRQPSSSPRPAPVVFMRGGGVFANSRDVAAFFGKEHRHVLRDIDNLMTQAGDRLPNFEQTVVERENPSGGGSIQSRAFDMDRDGFTLLAMGFTGAKALKWKLAYIAAFNRMEFELRAQADPAVALSDPGSLRILLLQNVEKVIALETKVAADAPRLEAFSRIAEADGSLCITDAAKTLQVKPKALFDFLRSHGWIYTPHGGRGDIAYSAKLQQGLMEHKTTTVHRSDGSEKVITQARVTPKGLARLAQEFPPPAVLAA